MPVWPPQATGLFEYKTPCCEGGCPGALLIPFATDFGPTPYPDEATAQDQLDVFVADCKVWFPFSGPDQYATFSIDVSVADTLGTQTITTGQPYSGGANVWTYVSFNLKAGATLTIPFSVTGVAGAFVDFIEATLYDCFGVTIIASDFVLTPTISGTFTLAVPADGEYILKLRANITIAVGETATTTFSVQSDLTMTINPVAALWAFGSTTRRLEC